MKKREPASAARKQAGTRRGAGKRLKTRVDDDPPLRSWRGTLKDLKALGDDVRVELIDGVLYERPMCSFGHGHVVSHLMGTLVAPYMLGKGGPGGWAIMNVDWIVGQEVLRPDLSGWRTSRLKDQEPEARASVVPDWVLEVLSPSTRAHDWVTKREAYVRLGVRYRWYVEPETRVLQAFELRGHQWIETGVFCNDDVVRAEPFSKVSIPMATWWNPRASTAPTTKREAPRVRKQP